MDILKPVQQKPPGWLRGAEQMATQPHLRTVWENWVHSVWRRRLRGDLTSVYNYPLERRGEDRDGGVQKQYKGSGKYWAQKIIIRYQELFFFVYHKCAQTVAYEPKMLSNCHPSRHSKLAGVTWPNWPCCEVCEGQKRLEKISSRVPSKLEWKWYSADAKNKIKGICAINACYKL